MGIRDLQQIFREVLKEPDLKIKDNLTAADVRGWDSFAHVKLILQLEKTYNTRFSTEDIATMKCVGDLVNMLRDRGPALDWNQL
jgi:acyl carrier protein